MRESVYKGVGYVRERERGGGQKGENAQAQRNRTTNVRLRARGPREVRELYRGWNRKARV